MAWLGCWLSVSVCSLAQAEPARLPKERTSAAQATAALDVTLQGGEGCAEPAQFAALLRARLAPSALQLSPLRFVLQLARHGSGVHATLRVLRGASVIERQLDAPSCPEALDALALVAALILDPTPASEKATSPRGEHTRRGATAHSHADRATPQPDPEERRAAPEAAPEEAEGGPEPKQQSPASVASAAAEPTASAAASPPAPPSPAAARGVDTEPAPRAPRHLVVSLFAGGLVLQGVAPAVRPGASVGLVLGARRQRLELSFELAGRFALPHRIEHTQGSARFTFWGGASKFCALGLFSQARMGLSGCAVAELGALGAQGSRTDDAGGGQQLWAALGPALRVELRTRRVWVRLGGELLLPLPRQRYTLADSTVFSVPYVTFRSELVLGVPLS